MKRPGKVFVITKEEKISMVQETPYDSEDVLQQRLANYPDLLAGDQISPEEPRRWLHISREMGVPGEEDTVDRWSLDHLFVDQDGVPTLVECKRASDTRLRRQVVAQMLDYAANATEYWPLDKLRQCAAETALQRGTDLDTEIQHLVQSEEPDAIELFWQNVEENLRTGRIRLLFVSETIPRELRRVVEFLNEHMQDTEVWAIEVKQYVGDVEECGGELKVMASRVLGLTEAVLEKKQQRRPPSPGYPDFLQAVREKVDDAIRKDYLWEATTRTPKMQLCYNYFDEQVGYNCKVDGAERHVYIELLLGYGSRHPGYREKAKRELEKRFDSIRESLGQVETNWGTSSPSTVYEYIPWLEGPEGLQDEEFVQRVASRLITYITTIHPVMEEINRDLGIPVVSNVAT